MELLQMYYFMEVAKTEHMTKPLKICTFPSLQSAKPYMKLKPSLMSLFLTALVE